MLRRFFFLAGTLAISLAGCKQNGNLAAQTATTALDASIFASPNNVQALTFTSGGERDPKPYALANFLYAKHWLTCKATQPGIFASTTACTFENVGRSYAHANGWTQTRPPGGCAQCETWMVPVAVAKLQRVTNVSATDKTHANATYAYDVVPTEIGAQLTDWMAKNPVAWCGPIPNVAGGWSKARSGEAAFAHVGQSWQVAQPPAGFATTFGDPSATPATANRPCSS